MVWENSGLIWSTHSEPHSSSVRRRVSSTEAKSSVGKKSVSRPSATKASGLECSSSGSTSASPVGPSRLWTPPCWLSSPLSAPEQTNAEFYHWCFAERSCPNHLLTSSHLPGTDSTVRTFIIPKKWPQRRSVTPMNQSSGKYLTCGVHTLNKEWPGSDIIIWKPIKSLTWKETCVCVGSVPSTGLICMCVGLDDYCVLIQCWF